MNNSNNVGIHSIPCPYGNKNVKVIIRDNINPQEQGDVISKRLEAGPIIYAMCPLALSVLTETYGSDKDKFMARIKEFGCPNPPSKNEKGCMYISANWEMLENFLCDPRIDYNRL